MEKVFVYYSFTGNGDYVAKELSDKGYKIIKLVSTDKMPKNKFLATLKGGYKALRKSCATLKDYSLDLDNISELVIGTPIWNGRFPPALNTLFRDNKFSHFTLLTYSAGGDSLPLKKKLEKDYKIDKYISLKNPKKNNIKIEI